MRMNLPLAGCFTLFVLSAGPATAAPEAHVKFESHKTEVLALLEARQSILGKERSCVEAANSNAAITACHEHAKASRSQMVDQARKRPRP